MCSHMWLDLRPVSFYSLRCLLFLVNTALCMTCLLYLPMFTMFTVFIMFTVFNMFTVFTMFTVT